MLGFFLLLIALLLYFEPQYRYYSYFLYLSFMMGYGGGFGLWTDQIIGIKNIDLALIYTFIINIYLMINKEWMLPQWKFMTPYKYFILFLGINALFSFFYYKFTPYQILQGGRSFLLLLSLPILIRIRRNEFRKLLSMLIYICILTSILYILQIVFKTAIMPYDEFRIDPSTGLPRFYNSPANLELFLALSILKPKIFGKRVVIYRLLFFTTLICTLGRTYIISSIMLIFLVLLIKGESKKIISTLIIIGLFIFPFGGIIKERYTGGNTSDIEEIFAGNFKEYNLGQNDATMVYRLAWVYERFDYIIQRNLGEQLFGLGLISDSQPWVYEHYNFSLGLTDPDTEEIAQLSTPDIAYGNLLTKLGFLGSAIYLWFTVIFTIWLYKQKKYKSLMMLLFASMTMMYLQAFSGSSLSETRSFAIYFFFLSLTANHEKYSKLRILLRKNKHENNTY